MEAVHYYFSGIGNFTVEQKELLTRLCTHRLQSCHKEYMRATQDWMFYAAQHKGESTILLDSGAFTGWSKGVEVKLDQLMHSYSDLISKYETGLKKIWLINLDKIPGQRGRTASTAEVEEAIKISDINFNIMVKEFGDRVLPVFHQNESKERLYDVCKMADYICVSPRNDVGEKYRISWSAEVHTLLAKYPKKIRTHGLATTGMRMLQNVDWFSADSAWWLQTALNGSIMYLSQDNTIKTIAISDRAGSRKDLEQHFGSLNKPMREYIESRIMLHNFTPKEVAEHHTPRQIMCIFEVLEWLKVSASQVKPLEFKGLFDL